MYRELWLCWQGSAAAGACGSLEIGAREMEKVFRAAGLEAMWMGVLEAMWMETVWREGGKAIWTGVQEGVSDNRAILLLL